MTYVPLPNLTTSVFQFGDLIDLNWHNLTFLLQIKLNSALIANYTIPHNSQHINSWFFTFDFWKNTMTIVRDNVVIDTAYLDISMMEYLSTLNNFITNIGYKGTLGTYEYTQAGFK